MFVINSRLVSPPLGVSVSNYARDGEPQFKYTFRDKPLTHIVLHETAGRSAKGCKQTLQDNGLGVHLIIDRSGFVTCHGDLARHVMSHGNQLNKVSIGIEVVNPYAPSRAIGMDVQFAPAEWWTWCPDKTDRRYVLPSKEQLNTLGILVPWLCAELGVSYTFPTAQLSAKKPRITGWKKPPLGWKAKPEPGIVAHQDFSSHSDGRYLLNYLITQAPDRIG